MISLSPSTPEPDAHAELKALLGQVERFRGVLLELVEVKKQATDLDLRRTEQEAAMRREQEVHKTKLWADREAFEMERKSALAEIKELKLQTGRLRDQAQADASRASEVRKEVEARLARIQALMAG